MGVDTVVERQITQLDIANGAVKPRHLDQGLAAVKFGLSADRPVAGTVYPVWFSLDTHVLSIWSGETWYAVTLV